MRGRPAPDLQDRGQRLTVKRMFDADNYRPVLPAADYPQVHSLRTSNFHKITHIQAHPGRNRRKLDPERVPMQTAKKRRLNLAIEQSADYGL